MSKGIRQVKRADEKDINAFCFCKRVDVLECCESFDLDYYGGLGVCLGEIFA